MDWDSSNSFAHTNEKDLKVIFKNPKIKFITCWFEDEDSL